MNSWRLFWRRVAAFLWLHTPIRSYGELVLGPVTIVAREDAFRAGHNTT